MSFALNPAWDWWLVTLAAAAGVGVVLWTYPTRTRHLSPTIRRTLLGLRLAAVALLIFALLRPEFRRTDTDTRDAGILVLADVSRSMTVADLPGGRTRYAALREQLAAEADTFGALGEEAELDFASFGDDLTPLPDGPQSLPDEPTADRTALGKALAEVADRAAGGTLSAVVLLTDAAQRATPPDDADPRDAARKLADAGVTIYGVPFGSDGAPTDGLDLAVEELLVDSVVFEKKQVPVTGRVRVVGGAGRRFTARLLVEDRTGVALGETGAMVPAPGGKDARPAVEFTAPVGSDAGGAVVPIELTFVPDSPGELKVALEVVPLRDELKQTNNRRETVVTVRKGGIRVAYFDQARPEVRGLLAVNLSSKIQLDYFEVAVARDGLPQSELPDEPFERDAYDAYIVGDLPADAFSPRQLRALADRLEDGAGFMMTGGLTNYGAGGWERTPVADAFPVDMRPATASADRIDPRVQIEGDVAMRPTRLGSQRYVMLLADPVRNAELWRELPPLNGASRLRKRGGVPVEVLADSPDGDPLLLAREFGRARVLAFAGDTTWLWRLSGFDTEHQRFWRQVILWLTRKEQDDTQPVFVGADPRNVAPGRPARLELGANDAAGEPVTDATFTVEIRDPAGGTSTVSPRPDGDRFAAEVVNTNAPGDYWVRVAAERDGVPLGPDAWTRFVVDARDLELDNPAADPALLAELTEITGGAVVPPERFESFLARWLTDPPGGEELSVTSRTPLYDHPWLPLLFTAIVGTEWYLRKKRGLV